MWKGLHRPRTIKKLFGVQICSGPGKNGRMSPGARLTDASSAASNARPLDLQNFMKVAFCSAFGIVCRTSGVSERTYACQKARMGEA